MKDQLIKALQGAVEATRVISSGFHFQIIISSKEGVMGRRRLGEVAKKQHHGGCEHRNLHTMLENDMYLFVLSISHRSLAWQVHLESTTYPCLKCVLLRKRAFMFKSACPQQVAVLDLINR